MCNGVCIRNKAIISSSVPKYANGIYRCTTCDIFLTVNGIDFGERAICRCCRNLVRSKPRGNKTKMKYYQVVNA